MEKIRRVFARRRFSRVEAIADDGENRAGVVWFNRPYLLNQLEEGASYHPPRRAETPGAGRAPGNWRIRPSSESGRRRPSGGGVQAGVRPHRRRAAIAGGAPGGRGRGQHGGGPGTQLDRRVAARRGAAAARTAQPGRSPGRGPSANASGFGRRTEREAQSGPCPPGLRRVPAPAVAARRCSQAAQPAGEAASVPYQ